MTFTGREMRGFVYVMPPFALTFAETALLKKANSKPAASTREARSGSAPKARVFEARHRYRESFPRLDAPRLGCYTGQAFLGCNRAVSSIGRAAGF